MLAVTALADSVHTAQQKAYKVFHALLLAACPRRRPPLGACKSQACPLEFLLSAVMSGSHNNGWHHAWQGSLEGVSLMCRQWTK